MTMKVDIDSITRNIRVLGARWNQVKDRLDQDPLQITDADQLLDLLQPGEHEDEQELAEILDRLEYLLSLAVDAELPNALAVLERRRTNLHTDGASAPSCLMCRVTAAGAKGGAA